MIDYMINAEDLAEELGLYLKIAVSTKEFDNYNSFYNIYSESEEPCRRIAVLTRYENLEEVSDDNPDKPLKSILIKDGNVWLKEYELTTNPNKIDRKEIQVLKEDADKIRDYFKSKS